MNWVIPVTLRRVASSFVVAVVLLAGIAVGPQSASATPEPEPPVDLSVLSLEQIAALAVEFAKCDPSGSPTAADAANAQLLNRRLQAKLAGFMTAYRVSCARMIVRAVQSRGLARRAAVIAITTAIVESGLQNYATAVDHDSLGLFQQRPSAGWGTPSQLIDPTYAANAFLNKMLQLYPNNAWMSAPIGEVCQRVQVSAFPDRYQVEAGDAAIIVDVLWNPPQKVAPAVLKYTSDGHAEILRWTSTGSRFDRISDWTGAGTSNLDAIGDRVAAGDVNGDGRDDLAALKQNPDGTFTIHVWRNAVEDNSSWFTSTGSYNIEATAAGRFVLGDWNGDGKAEPAVLKYTSDGHAEILRWSSTGSRFDRISDWVGAGTSNLDAIGDRVAAGDVNGDGRDDLAALKQNPDGTFTIHVWRSAVEDNTSWFTSTGSYNIEATAAGRFALGDWQ